MEAARDEVNSRKFTDFSIAAIMASCTPPIQTQTLTQIPTQTQTHIKTQTQNSASTKKYLCDFCSLSLCNRGQLRNHIRSHTGERPFKCDHQFCNKTFTRNEELTRHKRIHTGQRPFACFLCAKRFGRKDHLKKHIKTHDKRDPLNSSSPPQPSTLSLPVTNDCCQSLSNVIKASQQQQQEIINLTTTTVSWANYFAEHHAPFSLIPQWEKSKVDS